MPLLESARIGSSEVAETGGLFERDVSRQLDHTALGRCQILAKPAVRVVVE